MVRRVPTDIKGLDDKIEGGFVENSVVLLTGKTGTGKTSFCGSFLYYGALRGEPGVYITTEESEDDIREDIKATFGWDLKRLEEKGLLKILSIKPIFPKNVSGEDVGRLVKLYIFNFMDKISTAIKSISAKRCVIDSISVVEMFIKDPYLARAAIMSLIETLKSLKVTTIITSTIAEESEALSGGGIIEYLADAIIKLDFVPVAEEYKRTLTIRKMRRTNHSTLIHPFEITKEGIRIIEV